MFEKITLQTYEKINITIFAMYLTIMSHRFDVSSLNTLQEKIYAHLFLASIILGISILFAKIITVMFKFMFPELYKTINKNSEEEKTESNNEKKEEKKEEKHEEDNK